jgi:hypothetical protein
VFFSIVQKLKSILPGATVASLLASAAIVGLQDPAQAIIPIYTTTDVKEDYYATTPASLGFFFDTDKEVKIDAMGFAAQTRWKDGLVSYDVNLWSFTNAGNDPGDYTLIKSVTFTPTLPGLQDYYQQDGYFWENIPVLTLADSTTGDLPDSTNPWGQNGYVLGVQGDFSDNIGNVKYEGGTATFLPGIINNDSGYNVVITDPYWPIPVYPGGLGVTAYFNGNLSYAPVPGPLPVLGAAAGFLWTSRLRKRIRRTSM